MYFAPRGVVRSFIQTADLPKRRNNVTSYLSNFPTVNKGIKRRIQKDNCQRGFKCKTILLCRAVEVYYRKANTKGDVTHKGSEHDIQYDKDRFSVLRYVNPW